MSKENREGWEADDQVRGLSVFHCPYHHGHTACGVMLLALHGEEVDKSVNIYIVH